MSFILIVDDNKNFTQSLKSFFQKKGVTTEIALSYQSAYDKLKMKDYQVVLIDVVLSKVNGIELLKKIDSEKLLSPSSHIYLMSGILSRKVVPPQFDNLVEYFFKKPFNIDSLYERILPLLGNSKSIGAESTEIPFFYTIDISKDSYFSSKNVIIYGHELMFIVFYLHFVKFSGTLDIQSDVDGSKYNIIFYKGEIIDINSEFLKTYVGTLLTKKGLVSAEDIQECLKQDGSSSSLGERLVEGCYISPHVLKKTLREQLAIKIFEIMNQSKIVVKWIENDIASEQQYDHEIKLETKHLLLLVENWIKSKINDKWLRDFFLSNTYFNFRLTQYLSKEYRKLQFPYLEFLLDKPKSEKSTIMEIIKVNSENDIVSVFKKLYVQLLVWEGRLESIIVSKSDYSALRQKYQNFLYSINKKNYFEFFNISTEATNVEIEKTYRTLVSLFHQDKRESNMPKDMHQLYDKCFLLVQKVYQTLINPEKKANYLKKHLKATENESNANKRMCTLIKRDLENAQYDVAYRNVQKIFHSAHKPPETNLYYVWAFIKNKKEVAPTERQHLKDIFDKIGLDQKQGALYHFTKAMYFKEVEQRNKEALNFYKQAFQLDPNFRLARVEMYNLQNKKKFTLLNRFFKKKKGA